MKRLLLNPVRKGKLDSPKTERSASAWESLSGQYAFGGGTWGGMLTGVGGLKEGKA